MPTIVEIDAAARRIANHVWHTPLVHSRWLSDAARADVWLKLEVAQTTGSFKIRGATNALAVLRETRPGVAAVVTASAGNHGLALAYAARRLGMSARVHLPRTVPAAKRDALAELGVELVDSPTYDEAEARATDDARRSGAVYISPYNHPDVMAGAGTIALEMLADCPDLDVIVTPLGGGGLASGTAIVARSRARTITTIGAEAQASPAFTLALAAGRVVPITVAPTLADGLAGNLEAGSRTFPLVRDLVDRVVLVTESWIEIAMRELIMQERLVAEGASATAIGALLQGDLDLAGKHVGVVLSGRNVDGHVLRRVLGLMNA